MDHRNTRKLRNNIAIDKKRRIAHRTQPDSHLHGYFELLYLQHGRARSTVIDTVSILSEGDLLLVTPYTLHSNRYEGKGFNDRYALYFNYEKLDPRILPYLPFNSERPPRPLHLSVNPESRESFESALSSMLQLFLQNEEYSDILLDHMFQQFMMTLSSMCSVPSESPRYGSTEIALLESIKHIEEHFSEDLSLNDVASFTGFSPSYYSRKFKVLTGKGFREYRDELRLNKAASLLRGTDMSISEISARCGFSSSTYFGDAFKAARGVSPSGYRKQEED
ncbi:MAG: AraC family transcriptional regulator [Lachnospiraceae bacterium]|nr:AraC family transcriptional regulator [Lachnospiraceae bacterium]